MGLPTKVALRFGDHVSATVKLVTAVDREASLRMVCADGHDPAPVKMPAVCPVCGKEGSRYTFDRGKEVDGQLILVTAEELKAAAGPPTHEIVVNAHPLTEVLTNTFPGQATYLLVPADAISVETYCLIRQALLDNPGTALVSTFAVSSATKMWRIGVFEDGLSLTELAWPESVRARPAIPKVVIVQELRDIANEWVTATQVAFDPAAYQDTARAAREALLASRAGAAPAAASATVSTSLMDRLRASVETAKAAKEQAAAPTPEPVRPRARRARKSA